MTPLERRGAAGLAAIFGLRMFGLFLILPVFSIYGTELGGATPTLIGLAIGAYGLTQALLQIPMGLASDRLGRKPVILVGLLLFVAGSVLAALSDHIVGVILGRALQGGGAVAAAVLALAADLTEPRYRTRVMAMIGMSVGGAFMAALILGPMLAAPFGLAGLFWLTALLALVAVAVLYLVVPNPSERAQGGDAGPVVAQIGGVLRQFNLLRLDAGIFALHFVLTAIFLAVPLVLSEQMALPVAQHWYVYVPVLLLSVAGLVPAVIAAERYNAHRLILRLSVFGLIWANLLLALSVGGGWWFLLPLWLFFVTFNILEASLPSLISRYAPVEAKGTAMGVYSTSQFAGAFLGGTLGGVVLGTGGTLMVFLLCAVVAMLWLVLASHLGPIPERASQASETVNELTETER